MEMSQYHYLPLTPGFFSILVGILVVVFILLQLGLLRYAYLSLGVGRGTAMLLLVGSLLGSIFNIPVAAFAAGAGDVRPGGRLLRHALRGAAVVNWPGTVIAVNVGGAVIPTLMSLYLSSTRQLWVKGLIATAVVAVVFTGSPIRFPASASRSRYSCRP